MSCVASVASLNDRIAMRCWLEVANRNYSIRQQQSAKKSLLYGSTYGNDKNGWLNSGGHETKLGWELKKKLRRVQIGSCNVTFANVIISPFWQLKKMVLSTI